MTKKLYLVTLRGMLSNITGPAFGNAYVVATDPTEAYAKLRKRLDERDVGFSKDRELGSVTLIAESADYPDCGTIFYE